MSEQPQSSLHTAPGLLSRLKARTRGLWPRILSASGLLTLVVMLALFANDSIRLRHELSAPSLDAIAYFSPEPSSQLEELYREMIEVFFGKVFELSQANPGAPYHELTASALPIIREAPPSMLDLAIDIHNVGGRPATDVSLFVSGPGIISSLQARTLSPWQIIRGGQGSTELVLGIERVAVDETAHIEALFSTDPDSRDTLTLGFPPRGDWLYSFLGQSRYLPIFFFTRHGGSGQISDPFTIHVASNETPRAEVDATFTSSLGSGAFNW